MKFFSSEKYFHTYIITLTEKEKTNKQTNKKKQNKTKQNRIVSVREKNNKTE